MWRDVAMGVVWLAVTAMLFAAAWRAARRLDPGDSPMTRLMHAIVLAWATLTLSAVLLGCFGALSAVTLLTVVGAISMSALWALRGSSQPTAMAAADCWWGIGWVCLLSAALVRVALDGLAAFPSDWDTLTYHLPLVVQWLHAGSLYAPADAFWYRPGNNELWTLWAVAPFSGDFLHALTNIPATILLAVSTVELARRLGASKTASNLVGLASVAVWPVFRQLTTSENDVAVAALFLASLAYAARSAESRVRSGVAMAAVSIGLLAGTKYYALGYAAVAACVVVLMPLLHDKPVRAARTALVVLGGMLVFAGYWYGRNWVMAQAPTFPKGLSVATDLWAQMRPHSWQSTLLGSGRPETWPLALEAIGARLGLSALCAILAAPGAATWLFVSALRMLARPETAAFGIARGVIALAMPVAFLVLVTTPNFVEVQAGTMDMLLRQYLPSRFSLTFATICVVALGVVVSDVVLLLGRGARPGAVRRAIAAVLLAAVAGAGMLQLWRNWVIAAGTHMPDRSLMAVNLALVLLLIWASREAWPRARTPVDLTLAGAAMIGAVFAVACLGGRWHRGFKEYYFRLYAPALLEAVEAKQPSMVCVCDYRYYPFFGSDRGGRAHRPLWLPSIDALRRELRQHQAAWIVTLEHDPSNQARYANVRRWLDASRGFKERWSDGRHVLVEINLNSGDEGPP